MQLLRRLGVWLCAAGLTTPILAAEDTARVITLEECIRTAVANNLDVRIVRYDPAIAGYNLRGARGAYDPSIFAGVRRESSSQPGYFDPTIGNVPPSETDTESFNAGLRGLLPWGLTYAMQGTISERLGVRPAGSLLLPIEEAQGSISVNLTQPLLRNFWIDGTRLTIQLNDSQIGISEQSVLQQLMTTLNQVEVAYYDLILGEETVKVQEKALQLAERLLAENKKRVEVGAMAPLDEKQAEAQVAATRADLLGARRLLSTQQNSLKNLISSEYAEWHGVDLTAAEKLTALPRVFNLTDSWLQGLTQRPDVLQARMQLEQQGLSIKYRKNQLLPQLDLVGTYGRTGAETEYRGVLEDWREGDGSFYSFGLQINFPLGNRSARSALRAVQAQKEQTLLRLKQLEQNVMVQIDNGVGLAKTQFERVDATRKAREYAEAALQAEERKLENGKSTSFVVLQLQRDLTAASSTEVQALADYNKALASLALAEGSILTRHNINVKRPE